MNGRSPAVQVAPTSGAIVLRERLNDIAVLTLNKPDQRNSLSESMLAALGEAFASIATDGAIRVVVLAANGPFGVPRGGIFLRYATLAFETRGG